MERGGDLAPGPPLAQGVQAVWWRPSRAVSTAFLLEAKQPLLLFTESSQLAGWWRCPEDQGSAAEDSACWEPQNPLFNRVHALGGGGRITCTPGFSSDICIHAIGWGAEPASTVVLSPLPPPIYICAPGIWVCCLTRTSAGSWCTFSISLQVTVAELGPLGTLASTRMTLLPLGIILEFLATVTAVWRLSPGKKTAADEESGPPPCETSR